VPDDDFAVLDDPVGRSLNGRHAHLARRAGRTATYPTGVSTFATVPAAPTSADWDDLARLLGRGGLADLFTAPVTPPAAWTNVFDLTGFQMILDRPTGISAAPNPATDPEAAGPTDHGAADVHADRTVARGPGSAVTELGRSDVPDMLALTDAARPGPFWPRTIELGAFHGVRENGALLAMAGERLRPPGWTEISSVCTAPQARGRGLAAQVIRAAAARITARGERPFLHVLDTNRGAIRLYERLGFIVRTRVRFHGYRVP
jgi:ribosomal protein S18 acetylase RimI-like enzyme